MKVRDIIYEVNYKRQSQLELLLPGKTGLMVNDLKIIFFGTPDFAVPALKSLINFGYNIEAVITQPEKPVGRAKVILPSPVKKTALEHTIKVFEPHSLKKDEEFFKQFKHLNPDLCVVAAYGKIIPSQYLEVPKYGFINIHPSLLPKYRGPSPIQTAILNGDDETGVTIMKVDSEVDHGPTLSFVKHSVSNKDYKELESELAKLGAELLIDTISKYLNGEIKRQEQDHSQATFTKMFSHEDGKIDWNKPAEKTYNQIRALNPEPGTWTIWNSKVLKIIKAKIYDKQPYHEHENIYIGVVYKENGDVFIPCSVSHIEPEIVQLEGKKAVDIKSFVNGQPKFVGSKLE